MYTKHREVRSKEDKLAVDEIPESPQDCRFCMGPLTGYEGLFECCFIDPNCLTPESPMVCCLSLYGFCNMLKLKEDSNETIHAM